MIKLQGKLPKKIIVAVSGGVDSVVALDFLSKKHEVTILYVNHHDPISQKEIPFVKGLAKKYNVPLIIRDIPLEKPNGISKEMFWSKERKKIFNEMEYVVITAQTLNDSVETWIMSSLKGNPMIIPYQKMNVIRPFMMNKKTEFISWATRHNLEWIEDETNQDPEMCQRNYIRNAMMGHALMVNPGIEKTIAKKVKEQFENEEE